VLLLHVTRRGVSFLAMMMLRHGMRSHSQSGHCQVAAPEQGVGARIISHLLVSGKQMSG
jgi:hypothetical protein